MKKSIVIVFFALMSTFTFAIPNGCYNGTSGYLRGVTCAIQISGNTFNVCNKEGYVKARWSIVEDNDGRLVLKSEYGATATAYWWTEEGETYLKFNETIFVYD